MSPLNVLVTGSSGSIGIGLCQDFLDKGSQVTGLDLVKPEVIFESGTYAWNFYPCDLSNGNQVKEVLERIHSSQGAFDVVINNAGLIYNSPLLSLQDGVICTHDFQDWDKAISVNLSASFYVTAVCAQKMVSSMRKGVIINISSICANGNVGQVAYSAAKAGVNAMTVALAKELGAFGIRIAAIAPGFLDTPSTHKNVSEERLKHLRSSIPLRKLGKANDLIDAINFIIQNQYFHGKILELDGGLTL